MTEAQDLCYWAAGCQGCTVKNEEFDEELAKIMDEQPASHLLSVPGIYEVVSEHFNNEVLQRLQNKRDIEEEEVEDDG